jgi:branched-chain amino acid transport system permease protein
MSELVAQLTEWRDALRERLPPWWPRAAAIALIVIGVLLPLAFSAQSGFFGKTSGFMNATIIALAYVVMALGLNVVVGFAGLLDLGYVAFYALGAYCVGWFGSGFFFKAHAHILVSSTASALPGLHFNFILILVCAILITSFAGTVIGLPTLRLRGDYIAIVTLAFGEIIRVFAINGTDIHVSDGMSLTAGNLGISAVDLPYFPGAGSFSLLDLRPWYWLIFAIVLFVLFVNLRVRESRLGRAWIALREDETAAVSMGIPLVRTKLLAYAMGAAFGGMSGAFLGAYFTTINAGQFAFSFSIFVLAMIIVGGLGSIWGAVLGALLLSYINYYVIPDVLNSLPSTFGLSFNLTDLSFGIFGFLLVFVMVLRPQGLFPERRRKLELTEGVAIDETPLESQI